MGRPSSVKTKKDETGRKSEKLKSEVVTAADQLFNLYANEATNTIEPDGIELLCSDLGIEHTDVRILMLAWKMSAAKMGYFTWDKWRNGLAALKADMSSIHMRSNLTEYKVINRYKWMEFDRFCSDVSFRDMTNYDEASGFYPLILDNFVEWMKEGKN
ncbi:hypothetical protein MKX01_031671 [Papaver californicum]|nr:hypothetical protein MKX01_031671 [Papaver californicum]